MPAISKAAFFKPYRCNKEVYPLPEYGEGAYVVIQALTSRDIVAIQKAFGSSPDSGNQAFVNELFYRCLVDDDGKPIFDGPDDVAATLDMSLPAMEHLVETCLRVSGIQSKREEGKN
jgi:hypothetical protein